MDEYGWDLDSIDAFDDFTEDWYTGDDDSAEFIGPARGLAAARTLARKRAPRRPVPTAAARGYAPPPGALAQRPVSQPQLAGALKRVEEDVKRINAGIKTLENRLDSYSTQLIALQKRSDVETSGELFRSNLTSAALGAGSALKERQNALALAHGLSLLQTNFRAASTSIKTHAFSTVAFPLGTFLLAGGGAWLQGLLQKPAPAPVP